MEVLVASKDHQTMSTDLQRQRRNLLISSLVLISINLAGASFKDEISVFGAGIKFAHPERIVWGAWVLWGYFILRYAQYLSDEPSLGIHRALGLWIVKQYQADDPDKFEHLHIEWISALSWQLNYGEHVNGIWHPCTLVVSWWMQLALTVRGFLIVAIRTPRATDYILPFLIACLPPLLFAFDLVTQLKQHP